MKRKIHGNEKGKDFIKFELAVDRKQAELIALEAADDKVADSRILPNLIEKLQMTNEKVVLTGFMINVALQSIYFEKALHRCIPL